MTDLGFGLADRRSVMVVLFVFLLSSVLFGHSLPIDTTNAVGLFTSLVILTGFLFASRTVCRILLASAYTIVRMPFDLFKSYKVYTIDETPPISDPNYSDIKPHKTRESRSLKDSSRFCWRVLRHGVSRSFTEGFLFPLILVQDWEVGEATYYFPIVILGVLDRLLLIAIAFAATLPSLSAVRQNIGLMGIGLLLLAYVLTGRFTIVLKDAFHKAEEDHDRLVAAAGHPDVSFPKVIETQPYRGEGY